MIDAAQSTPYVGRSLRRREDIRFLTGNGHYVDDIKLPGTLYLAILRSPHAHARITDVDLSTARAAAGVRLVLTGADLSGQHHNPASFEDRECYSAKCLPVLVRQKEKRRIRCYAKRIFA